MCSIVTMFLILFSTCSPFLHLKSWSFRCKFNSGHLIGLPGWKFSLPSSHKIEKNTRIWCIYRSFLSFASFVTRTWRKFLLVFYTLHRNLCSLNTGLYSLWWMKIWELNTCAFLCLNLPFSSTSRLPGHKTEYN
jgi:hypothetical protein